MRIFTMQAAVAVTGILAMAASSSPLQAQDNSPGVEIYASVYSTNSWKEAQFEEIGIYRFNSESYAPQLVMQDPNLDASGGGVMTDDFYFCTKELDLGSWVSVTHYIFDPETWTEIESLPDGSSGAVATDMTYDPLTAKVYGCFNNDNGDGYVFGSLNIADGERFAICDIDVPWIACSVNRNGQLYAVDMAGDLFSVNKNNGQTTLIGNVNVTASRRSSGAIDPRTGIFYVVFTNVEDSQESDYEINKSALYAIDISTAQATKLYDLADGEAVGGMFIPGPVAQDGAPAAATDLVLTFSGGSLTGTATFNVPATTFDGTPASGQISYTIRANGSLAAQGTTSFGAEVNTPVSVQEAGNYEFELVLTNAVGNSPKVKTSMWVGEDMPEAVSDVVLTYSNGAFDLSWTAPVESQNGGYFDPTALTYTVTRMPDNVVVARDITATFIHDPVAMPEELVVYSYEVKASYKGVVMLPVTSNIWRLGYIPLPFNHDFSAEDSFDNFTVIDVNKDNVNWYREYDWYIEDTDEVLAVACYPYSSSAPADDWFVTPPLKFEAGTTYTLTFNVMCNSADYDERLAVALGLAPTASALTQEILPATTLSGTAPAEKSASFTVNETGVYYIGFHAISYPDKAGIGIRDISVTAEKAKIHDVTATTVTVAPEIIPNRATEVSVTVGNVGQETESFSVELFRNGQSIASKPVENLVAGTSTEVTFEDILSPFDPSEIEYHAVANLTSDEDTGNNTTPVATSSVVLLNSPAVATIDANVSGNDVTLSWDAPTLPASAPKAAAPVTEDFESYEPWAIDKVGEWSFTSLDETPANPMELAEIPHLDGTTDIAYILTDNTGLDPSFAAHSGSKYLMAVYNDEYNDDWVISPELSGDAQTISFWGKSYDDYYLENIAVRYTTGDSENIDDFEYADGNFDEIPAEWTKFTAALPEGTKRFAIGYVSECKVAFQLDDITYIPATTEQPVTLLGYNIYRNQVKLNDQPVEATTFTDMAVPVGNHTYNVTAVCSHGESVPSAGQTVIINVSGIDSAIATEGCTVRTEGRDIIVTGACGNPVSIQAVDGRVLLRVDAATDLRQPALPGIYIVTVGRAATKLIIL